MESSFGDNPQIQHGPDLASFNRKYINNNKHGNQPFVIDGESSDIISNL